MPGCLRVMSFIFSPFALWLAVSALDRWDSPAVIISKLLVIAALVALNGFFVAAEFALVKVRHSQVHALTMEGNKRATISQHVVENLNAYLSACQLGITLASLGLGWLGEPFLARMLQPFFAMASVESIPVIRATPSLIAFVPIPFLHIVLGEQAPKILAIRKALATSI